MPLNIFFSLGKELLFLSSLLILMHGPELLMVEFVTIDFPGPGSLCIVVLLRVGDHLMKVSLCHNYRT